MASGHILPWGSNETWTPHYQWAYASIRLTTLSSPHKRFGRTPEFQEPGSDRESSALQPFADCTKPYPTSGLRETRAKFPAFSANPSPSAVSVACPACGSAHHYPPVQEIVKGGITGSLCVKETSAQPPPNAFLGLSAGALPSESSFILRRKRACYQWIGSEHSLTGERLQFRTMNARELGQDDGAEPVRF